jgi:hypothetical protein
LHESFALGDVEREEFGEHGRPDGAGLSHRRRRGDRLFNEGSEQSESADDYVKTTVFLAAVLFLVGVSTRFPIRGGRYG